MTETIKYQEYCPLGVTDKTIDFEISDGREPSSTTPCICGGTEAEKTAEYLAGATQVLAINAAINGSETPPVYQAIVHASAIRRIG